MDTAVKGGKKDHYYTGNERALTIIYHEILLNNSSQEHILHSGKTQRLTKWMAPVLVDQKLPDFLILLNIQKASLKKT